MTPEQLEASRKRNRRYRETHREYLRERTRQWRIANPELNREIDRRSKAARIEKTRAYSREYGAAHRHELRDKAKAKRLANLAASRSADKAFREANPDVVGESRRRYRSKSDVREKERVARKRYNDANKAANAAKHKAWIEANRGRWNATVMKRHAKKLMATPPWASADAIRIIYEEAARLTKATGIRHEVDHIIPLQSPIVCGLHHEGNLQILTKSANRQKWNHLPVQIAI